MRALSVIIIWYEAVGKICASFSNDSGKGMNENPLMLGMRCPAAKVPISRHQLSETCAHRINAMPSRNKNTSIPFDVD